MTSSITIDAKLDGFEDLTDPQAGERLAVLILEYLQSGISEVFVELRGIAGITTGFSNLFFLTLLQTLTVDQAKQAVHLRPANALQRTVLRRGLEGARGRLSGDATRGLKRVF